MVSIKVKFRPSTIDGKEGTIYYQVIKNRVVRQIKTDYRIFNSEWDDKSCKLVFECPDRYDYLRSIEERIKLDVTCVEKLISRYEYNNTHFTSNDIVEGFQTEVNEQSFFKFMQKQIAQLKLMGKYRTSETYHATLNSFTTFRNGKDLLFAEFDSDLMLLYESYLHNRGVTKNSSSFYMRILRAVYNRAVEKELTKQCHPFKHVYTGIDKTVKRAIPLKAIKQIKNLDLSLHPSLDFARDMFLFSFYTRGMSFIDMAYLKKKDLSNGILSYRRHKTGQQLYVKWEQCMQDIFHKWENQMELYLLPILKSSIGNERCLYKHTLYAVNKSLKEVAKMVKVTIPLTMYVARHSWASAARSKRIPLSVISEGMGHDSETTTQIYLASLDSNIIDDANSIILKGL